MYVFSYLAPTSFICVFGYFHSWFYWQVRKEQSEDLKQSLADEGETGGGDILNLDDGGDSTDSEASGTGTPEHKERY